MPVSLGIIALFGFGVGCTGWTPAPPVDNSLTDSTDSDTNPVETDECIAEGEELYTKSIEDHCCSGLVAVATDQPSDEYWSESYPPGCGPGPTPPDVKLCVSCGDDSCGVAENFCNCPADCDDGEIGPSR